jgi:hypothetical protein
VEEYRRRLYRLEAEAEGLVSFRVVAGESDLLIWADRDLSGLAVEELLAVRAELQGFIELNPRFRESLVPYSVPAQAPPAVASLAEAAEVFGVGPMAGVAGVVADRVGRVLLEESKEVMVENGGDLFIANCRERRVGIFAGRSPFSGKLALAVPPVPGGQGICTSSATVGPSLSLGNADAALVKADSATLADAAATALGNRVRGGEDLEAALDEVMARPGVMGALVILGERLGAAGDIRLA